MKVYAAVVSVIFAALIVQSAQQTAADCTSNCQDRFGRNATVNFDNDCRRGVQQSYVDCLADGSCLNNINVKTGIQQRYEICSSSYQGEYSSSGGKQTWMITCCRLNTQFQPYGCTDTCSLTSAVIKPLPAAAMLSGAVTILMLIL